MIQRSPSDCTCATDIARSEQARERPYFRIPRQKLSRKRDYSRREITKNAQGVLAAAINGGAAQPMPWIEGWKFGRTGGSFITFERTGSSGPATVVRYDGGGGYYILKRVPQ